MDAKPPFTHNIGNVLRSLANQLPWGTRIEANETRYVLSLTLTPNATDHSFLMELVADNGDYIELCCHIAGTGKHTWRQ